MFTLCSSLVFVIWAIINIANATHNKMTLLFVLLFSVAIFIFVLYFLKLKRETKKIKVIGEIEFTTSLLRKRIGDSLTEYNYQTIKEIEIQKHIPATSAIDLQNGYFSYILKIIFTDLHSESIVISNKSINRRKKLTIIETLEKETKRNIEVMWLMKGLVPDHNTISNFRRDNPKAIRKVFQATVGFNYIMTKKTIKRASADVWNEYSGRH